MSSLIKVYQYIEHFFFVKFDYSDKDNLFRGRVFLAISAISIVFISYFMLALSLDDISFFPYLSGMMFCTVLCTIALRFFPKVKLVGLAFAYSIASIFVYTSFLEGSLLNLNYFWYSTFPLVVVFLSGLRSGLFFLLLICGSILMTTSFSSELVARSLEAAPLSVAVDRARMDIIGAVVLVFFVGLSFDIQRRRMAREIQRFHDSEKRLKELESQLMMRDTSNRIVRRLCHEINNPLNVIMGYSEIINSGKSKDIKKIALKIEKSSIQINGVVKKLAEVAHTGDVGNYIKGKEEEIYL